MQLSNALPLPRQVDRLHHFGHWILSQKFGFCLAVAEEMLWLGNFAG
jgi:hypothetical protein